MFKKIVSMYQCSLKTLETSILPFLPFVHTLACKTQTKPNETTKTTSSPERSVIGLINSSHIEKRKEMME